MTYPPVVQFETRALEAEARATLSRERRAARPTRPATQKLLQLITRLPRARAVERPPVSPRLTDCRP